MISPNPRPSDRAERVERVDGGLQIFSERGCLRVEPKREDILRIRYAREPLKARVGDGILQDKSIENWTWETEDGDIVLRTARLTARISRQAGTIRYFDGEGRLLLAETGRSVEPFEAAIPGAESAEVWEEIQTPDGVKRVLRRTGTQRLYHTALHMDFRMDERLYGLGQAEEGLLNLRGNTVYLHQANRKIAVPFLVSPRGWGMLWATDGPSIFQDTCYGSYFYTEADEEMDYYFLAGKNMDAVVGGYRFLTGKAALPPRWAMGYFQSQERYETGEELLDVAREYRERGIGLDCVVLDWCSWPDGEWGQKTFDPKRFPDMKKTVDALHAMDVRLMMSIWPNMAKGCADYKAFEEKGLLLPGSDIYDAFDPAARALYWRQVETSLLDKGVDAWWCDSCEPFAPEWSHVVKPDPARMYAEYVDTVSRHIPIRRGNAYALFHTLAVAQGQRSVDPGRRALVLARSAHTGQQRVPCVLWSGDTEASWKTLRRQIAAGLNFCASGFPYWTLDIGAFFVKRGEQWFWNGDYDKGMEDFAYRELFVRWHQLGGFLPVFRGHGTDTRRELWRLDSADDHRFYRAAVEANRLRYRLMPYIYSLAGGAWLQDGTIMRMLAFDFPEDEKAMDTADQFMFGPALMVCPVTEPMYYTPDGREKANADIRRTVYLPRGTKWYDFYTHLAYEGGQEIAVQAPLDRIPLFVRAGSVIPVSRDIPSTAALTPDLWDALVFAGADGSFTLYEDAGDGYGYETGDYRLTGLNWRDAERRLSIDRPSSGPGWYQPAWNPAVTVVG